MTDSIIMLEGQGFRVRVHRQGGAILDAWYQDSPVLRPYQSNAEETFSVLDAGCFPLVPFAGRIEGNAFEFGGCKYSLLPNTVHDKHVLHGDGWLGHWDVVEQSSTELVLSFRHRPDEASPFDYEALQSVSLSDGCLSLQLTVTHCGAEAFPYGLGFHPFFPLAHDTRMAFEADRLWDEREDHLPGTLGPIPAALDFLKAQSVPNHWIHAGYEGWTGRAMLQYPMQNLTLHLEAGQSTPCLQLFRPAAFAQGDEPYICLEPMTHTCNAHRLEGDCGLKPLEQGESLSLSFRISVL